MSGTAQRCCPVCAADDAAAHWTKGALQLVRCRRCAMLYANPAPAELLSGEFYQRRAGWHLSADKLAGDFAPARFERELRLFRRYCAAGAVLDVGCSTGAFLHQLQQRFPGAYRLTGTDVAGAALAHAAALGLEVLPGSFLAVDFGGRQFDAISFWAVLEHLAEPRLCLQRAAALLRPGGLCFVLVPNSRSLAVRLLGPRYRYVAPQHLNYFSAETLRRLVATVPAFELVALKSTHFNPVVLWQDWVRPRQAVPDEERARLLRRTTAWKQRRWLAPLKALYRLVEAGLGRLGLADNLVAVLRHRDG